ncbi:MAG: hypothetical protein ACRDSR_13790 [Pseudonocardiaceae bacterium]
MSTDPVRNEPPGDPWAAPEDTTAATSTDPGLLNGLNGKAKLGKRERVVLAKRRSSRRVVRTLAELEDQTGVGEVLVRQLVGVQLALALRLMLLSMAVLGAIPLTLWLLPSLGAVSVGGLRLPWLVLGLGVYPFFVAVAWSYIRSADRNEQDFAEMVEN